MSFPWDTVTSVFSAAAAGGALLAAGRANQTAKAVARIESERRHEELTPQLDIDFREVTGSARVHFFLNGPDSLGHLDEVTITVEDDDMDHTVRNPERGFTQDMVDAHVWGPFRFIPHTDQGDANGRRVGPFPFQVGRGRPLSMERTRPGYWMEGQTQAVWQQHYADQPIRLRIVCCRGDEEWVIARRVENPPAPAAT